MTYFNLCTAHADGQGPYEKCPICERDRLRVENSDLRADYAEQEEEYRVTIKMLMKAEAELTEARKPDCRTCMHRDVGVCRLEIHRTCVNGDGHMPYIPLRLYEKEGKV